MASNSIITYKGKEILYLDYTGLRGNDLLDALKLGNKMIGDYKGGNVLTISNFTDAIISEEVMKYLKSDEVKNNNKFLKRAAVVGVVGIKKLFLNIFNSLNAGQYKAFDTLEDAKEYLIKE